MRYLYTLAVTTLVGSIGVAHAKSCPTSTTPIGLQTH
jgi:hypothetical protein